MCTFNRVRMLEETVRSFLDCQTDGIEYELLVVDNNSADKTRDFTEEIAIRIPRIRYLFESLQGIPHARNCGVRESRGEIVVFVDDDVYFSPGWLKALTSAFERNDDAAIIGGKVVPHFDAERPSWLDDNLLWIYGVTRYGDHEREIKYPDIPIGCNMAFRRAVFEQIGYFHSSLGRKGGNLLSNDENHFLLRAANAGITTIYSPDVLMSHRIPPARTNREWVLRRYYWQGVSDVIMRQVGDGQYSRVILTKKTIKTLFDLLRQWRDTVGLLSARNRSDDGLPIRKQLNICYKIGELRQMIAESLSVQDGNAAYEGRRGGDK